MYLSLKTIISILLGFIFVKFMFSQCNRLQVIQV